MVRIEISKEEILAVSVTCMAIYWPTPAFQGRTCKLCGLNRWDFNFCIHSSLLQGIFNMHTNVNTCDSTQGAVWTPYQSQHWKLNWERYALLQQGVEPASAVSWTHSANAQPTELYPPPCRVQQGHQNAKFKRSQMQVSPSQRKSCF